MSVTSTKCSFFVIPWKILSMKRKRHGLLKNPNPSENRIGPIPSSEFTTEHMQQIYQQIFKKHFTGRKPSFVLLYASQDCVIRLHLSVSENTSGASVMVRHVWAAYSSDLMGRNLKSLEQIENRWIFYKMHEEKYVVDWITDMTRITGDPLCAVLQEFKYKLETELCQCLSHVMSHVWIPDLQNLVVRYIDLVSVIFSSLLLNRRQVQSSRLV